MDAKRLQGKDVGRALRLVAADVCTVRPDHGRIAADRYGDAKHVVPRAIGGGQLVQLTLGIGPTLVAIESVGRAFRFAADLGVTRPDDSRVAVDRHGGAKVVIPQAIGGGQFRDLAPGVRTTLVAIEDVGRTLIGVADDVGARRPDDGRVAAERY